MNPNNNLFESQETTDQPDTFLDECHNLADLSRNKLGQATALVIATIGGVAAAHAAIDQSEKPPKEDVYKMSAEELARPTLHEFVTGKREEAGEMVVASDEIDKKLPEKCKANLNKCLFKAVKKGDLKTLQMLIEKGADVNVKDDDGMTPLSIAVWLAHKEDVHFLLENGADVNAKDSDGRTPLTHATANGHAEITKFLIEKGADVNAEDSGGSTPLMYATGNGHSEIAKLLIEKGADVNAKDARYSRTPLMHAAWFCNAEIVKLLIEKSADVNAKTSSAWTPLMYAAMSDRTENVKLLIEKGADVNAKDTYYSATTLIQAAMYGRVNVVKLLLKNGADPNIKAPNGKTALGLAREKGHTDVVELLEQAESSQP